MSQEQTTYQLPKVTQIKQKTTKDYQKQLARVTFLKKNQQKNLQLAKLYQLAVEKLQVGQDTKEKLRRLKSEADLINSEEMKRRKEQIEEIKRKEKEFINIKNGLDKEDLKTKQSYAREYKSRLMTSTVMMKSAIVEKNRQTRQQIYENYEEVKKNRVEQKEEKKKLNHQNYEEKVQREMQITQELQNKIKELEKNEQQILGRLTESQNILSLHQRRFQEVNSNPQSKRKPIKESTSSF